MRSRIAITLMLVFGFAFSGAGVGLAVTGVSTEGQSAADVQYPEPVSTPVPASATPVPNTAAPNTPAPENAPAVETLTPEVVGETDEGGNAPAGDQGPGSNVAPAQDESPVEETRQLGAEAGGEELPFTGFAAIPVLLLGFALLTSGFVLRRGKGGASN